MGRMHFIRRLDAQLLQFGCTTFVGRMHNFSNKKLSYLTTYRPVAQFLKLVAFNSVGRTHNKPNITPHIGYTLVNLTNVAAALGPEIVLKGL